MAASDWSATRDTNASIVPGNIRSDDFKRDQQIINSIRQIMADVANLLIANDKFTDILVSGGSPTITLTDEDTGSDCQVNASSSTGSMFMLVDLNNEASGSVFRVSIDSASNNDFQVEAGGDTRIAGNAGLANGNDFYSNNGTFMSSDSDGIFADRSGSNIDHIWHDDAPSGLLYGEWNFRSDSSYKATTVAGMGGIRASTILTGEVTIANNSTGTIRAPVNGGFFFLTLGGRDSFPQWPRFGIAMFDVGNSVSAGLLVGGPNFAVVAGNVTGTTGAVGDVTVGVITDNVKVENRFGSTQNFTYFFIG